MNKDERQQYAEAWLEAENLITLIDPQFKELGGVINKPEKPSVADIKKLMQFLRVEIRSLLHDKESLEREKTGLLRFIKNHGDGKLLDGNLEE